MELSKLKPIVNNPTVWKTFLDYIEPHEKLAMGNLLNAKETEQLWRAQGFMSALKLMKEMKDRVNASVHEPN